MRIDCSKLFAGLLVTVFGTLSILGHALHSLPGLDHFSGRESATSCHCCHQCTTPVDDADSGIDGERCGATAHECPICDFLALAKTHAADWPQPIGLDGVHFAQQVRSDSPNLATFWSYSARGPPLSTLS